MSKIYQVALIGCGHMGAAHLQEISQLPQIGIRYLCDTNENRALQFQKQYQGQNITTDYQDCINDPDVDIVIIATLPSSHLEILEACLQKGKHVLCEKPVGCDAADGQRFLELLAQYPESKVLVGHILRHHPSFQKLAELIQNGAIGSPILFRMVQNHHTIQWEKYKKLLQDASPLVDCGVHYIDLIQWFTGAKVTDIQAIGMRTELDLEPHQYNHGLSSFKLSDGSTGYYEAGWSNTLTASNVKEFSGPKGRLTLTLANHRSCHQEEGDLIEYYTYPEKVYHQINIPCKSKPTDAQFLHLIKMIEEDVPASPTAHEVIDAFDIMLQADAIIKEQLEGTLHN